MLSSWLTKLFDKILMIKKMYDERRKSIFVPIYKNKGNILKLKNQRRIRLIVHLRKIFEKSIHRNHIFKQLI